MTTGELEDSDSDMVESSSGVARGQKETVQLHTVIPVLRYLTVLANFLDDLEDLEDLDDAPNASIAPDLVGAVAEATMRATTQISGVPGEVLSSLTTSLCNPESDVLISSNTLISMLRADTVREESKQQLVEVTLHSYSLLRLLARFNSDAISSYLIHTLLCLSVTPLFAPARLLSFRVLEACSQYVELPARFLVKHGTVDPSWRVRSSVWGILFRADPLRVFTALPEGILESFGQQAQTAPSPEGRQGGPRGPSGALEASNGRPPLSGAAELFTLHNWAAVLTNRDYIGTLRPDLYMWATDIISEIRRECFRALDGIIALVSTPNAALALFDEHISVRPRHEAGVPLASSIGPRPTQEYFAGRPAREQKWELLRGLTDSVLDNVIGAAMKLTSAAQCHAQTAGLHLASFVARFAKLKELYLAREEKAVLASLAKPSREEEFDGSESLVLREGPGGRPGPPAGEPTRQTPRQRSAVRLRAIRQVRESTEREVALCDAIFDDVKQRYERQQALRRAAHSDSDRGGPGSGDATPPLKPSVSEDVMIAWRGLHQGLAGP